MVLRLFPGVYTATAAAAVALRSLTEHIDTATAAGKMLYAVLGAVAQFERDVLRERTIAGMRAAKSRGEHIGRPKALKPTQVREARAMLAREPLARRTRWDSVSGSALKRQKWVHVNAAPTRLRVGSRRIPPPAS